MSYAPLERHEIIRTRDLDKVREKVGQLLTPHRLELVGCSNPLNARVLSFRGRDMSVSLLNYGADVRIAQQALESYFAVLAPISGRIGLRVGGEHVAADSKSAAVLSPPDSAEMRWTSDCRALIVRIEQTSLQARLSELVGEPLSAPLQFAPRMDLGCGRGLSWRCMLMHWVDEVDRPSGLVSALQDAEPFENLLMTLLLRAQPNNYSHLLDRGVGVSGRANGAACPQYIREARRLLEDHPEWNHTVENVANYVGYTVRALQKGFRKHVGVSPMAYLRQIRLRRVHDDLLAASPDSATVDAIAHRWGFSHHGHFAGSYRNEFGETPKATLRR